MKVRPRIVVLKLDSKSSHRSQMDLISDEYELLVS